ncbi:MAG: UDP-glucose dehydrogenase family protein [Candidatus Kariarchaeaceae archaeon]
MEKLRIGILGTGYVGLVTGVCFAELGFSVICGDIIPEKVEKINKGIAPIYEQGLEELLRQLLKTNLIKATLDTKEVVETSDVIFICTGTPSREDGSIELKYITSAAEDIGSVLKETSDFKTIVVKSTVVPGTTSNHVKSILEKTSGKQSGVDFGLGMNPEFLKEGIAIEDFKVPDRIVIGAEDEKSFKMISALYESFTCPILKVNLSTAEMTKYASNSFLATKITFINEIANMSELLDVDVNSVAEGMGLDQRISPKFLRAGVGFGGSCFGKDVRALNALGISMGRKSNLLEATVKTNDLQPLRAVQLLRENIEISGKRIALLGLAFKPETDDMREAPSIPLVKELLSQGATVIGYDPIAKTTAPLYLPPEFILAQTSSEAIQDADAVILVTEWQEFKELTPVNFSSMKGRVIIDGRRIFDAEDFKKAGYSISVIGGPIFN